MNFNQRNKNWQIVKLGGYVITKKDIALLVGLAIILFLTGLTL